jgi:hypothetical protein
MSQKEGILQMIPSGRWAVSLPSREPVDIVERLRYDSGPLKVAGIARETSGVHRHR